MPAEMNGIDAIRGKHEWWEANNDVHSMEVNGPFLGEGQFAVQFTFDATFKPTGQRQSMTEMGLYTVKDGKIRSGAVLLQPGQSASPVGRLTS